MRLLKKILLSLLSLLLLLLVWQHELVGYGLMQARGQFNILWNARPVADCLQNPEFPDTLKYKLWLIAQIKQFTVDSLGLDPSDSYTKYYDQQGKPLLWIITACEPYELKAKEWEFPIIGSFSYKGFFDREKLLKAEKDLQAEEYDTEIDEVSAYSTLGWLSDPVLSSMLRRSEGSLASLIIHELTHGTLFVPGKLSYNENLADFVGDYGASGFLAYRFGKNSRQYLEYEQGKSDYRKYAEHILRGRRKLDSLYHTFKGQYTRKQKDSLKQQFIQEIVSSTDTLSFRSERWKQKGKSRRMPNNATFIGYLTYRSKQNLFEKEFKEKFGSDFVAHMRYLKQQYTR
jgi:predicted aminopeptidase